MQIGLSIPSTVEGTDRDTLCEWIRRIDAGPFSRLATGERIASPFLDLMGVLSAAAVLTERVPIQALISLAPLHEPVLLAKQAATVDVLSQGRFTLGVGVGMRDYDYTLAGKPEVFGRRVSTLDDRVQVRKQKACIFLLHAPHFSCVSVIGALHMLSGFRHASSRTLDNRVHSLVAST